MDNEQTFKHYVSELISINLGLLAGKSDTRYFSCITHGLTEELLELALAVDYESKVSELGDVFAYATLVILASELDNPVHNSATSIRDSIVTAVSDELTNAMSTPAKESLLELAQIAAGNFKRYFRNEPGYASNAFVAELAACAFNCVKTNVTLTEVLQYNLSKLEGRLRRGTLDNGTGEHR